MGYWRCQNGIKMKKILLIDDESTFRDTMGTLLRHHGYEVMDAADGLAGVRMARNNRPDLVLSDVVMEPVDGFMTLSILRQQPDTATVPFVLMTGHQELDRARKGLVLGADDYLTKPFSPEDLLETVKNLLDRRSEALAAAAEQVKRVKDLLFAPLPEELAESLASISGCAAQVAASGAETDDPMIGKHGNKIFGEALKLRRDIRHALILGELNVIAGDSHAKEVLREAETCDLQDMVKSQGEKAAESCRRKGDLQLAVEPVRIAMGSQPLSKLLEEVIGNAFLYSPGGSPLTICSTVSDQHVMLVIENQVPEEAIRLEGNPDKSVVLGTGSDQNFNFGLGLKLSRRLVELHGGVLTVVQRANRNIAVRIELPIVRSVPASN
jgi:two-component system, sensor histidine kinase and response regulator